MPQQPDPHPNALEMHYQQMVQAGNIDFDQNQYAALKHLQNVQGQLLAAYHQHQQKKTKKLLLAKWRTPVPITFPSLYLFGDVGRGKSLLMAMFYEVCPIKEKRRVHFSRFMQEVHQFIHHYPPHNSIDALTALAREISGTVRLLCFDEFHVTDIADAMLLGRLFSQLFAENISIIMTSNRHPNELYQGGLQREQFLFFIDILRKSAQIIELTAHQDYRMAKSQQATVSYYHPLNASTQAFIHQNFQRLAGDTRIETLKLTVNGRQLPHLQNANGIVKASFSQLCGQALGAADYLAIAAHLKVLVLSDIPKLTPDNRNEAKRFVTLVDILYEHQIAFICSAEVPVADLYREGDGAFEFRRTASRLMEMQSQSYWHNTQ